MVRDLLEYKVLLGFKVLVFEENGFICQHESFAFGLKGLYAVEHRLFLLFVLLCLLKCLLSEIV